MNITHANRGRSLETIIIASQRDVVRLDKLPTAGRHIRRGGAVAFQRVASPPDFIGTVVNTGRAIQFDAKQCGQPASFPLSQIAPHQSEWLIRHGLAGAIAGILIEATHARQCTYYWLDWKTLRLLQQARATSVRWDEPLLTPLGDTLHTINFARVPGVADGK